MNNNLRMERDSPLPLYYQLKEQIRQKIESGQWKPGAPIPSEDNLCRNYGVSRGTVRQAISVLENEGLLVRRHGYGTYVTGDMERSQKVKVRTKTIGLIVPYLRDSYTVGILSGVSDVAHKAGYSVVFTNSGNLLDRQRKEIAKLLANGVEGMVIFPVDRSVGDRTFRQLKAEHYFVLVDRYLKDLETDYVVSDNLRGGYEATRYLIELGHKRIGFIVSPLDGSSATEHRYNGYRQALQESNIPLDESLVKIITTKASTSPKKIFRQAYTVIHYDLEKIESFLARKDRPTAIFTVNDLIALDTLKVAKKLRLRVPEDLSLVGFDNIDIVSHLEVPLTTVHQAKYEMGAEAAKILIEKIEKKDNTLKKVVLPTQLVIRKSCAKL